jgi:hypothetical protein
MDGYSPKYGNFIGFDPSPYSNHWRVGLPNRLELQLDVAYAARLK